MGRTPCCNAEGLKKGAWTADEDKKLITYIKKHGEGGWRTLPSKAGLQRCGKSCRLRWANYLRPDIKRGQFSSEEEQKIIQLHATFGNRWSIIARHLAMRTDNEIKNYWNTYIKKRLTMMAVNPVTHKPVDPSPGPSGDNTGHESNPSGSHSENARPTTSSRPSSSSSQLLNKLATKLPLFDSLKDCQSHQSMSDRMYVKDGTNKEPPSIATSASPDNTLTMPRPVSSSVSLLNKMASRLTAPFHCLDTLKFILSKSIEGRDGYGTSSGGGGGGGGGCDSDPGNSYYMPRSTSTSSLSEATASELSMPVSNSNGVPEDCMAKDLVPLDDPFDLELLNDWQGVLTGLTDAGILECCSDGGVSSTSAGYAYNNIESPVDIYPRNFMQSNSSTISTHESLSDLLGPCSDGS